MKLISLLFLTLFLGKGCENTKAQEIDAAIIEYVANTRGFYQKIVVEKQQLSISKERDQQDKPVATKISDADWNELINLFQDLNLEEIPDLKSPTEKRFYDGAAIANLKITYKGKIYESKSFDHGFPPVEIKKLVNKINSFAKQNDEN
ncbi:hypothetical protein [Flavobacterium granuli]|uniref:Uncharacterized protein n=1 Tax=Flavobacterium granuli TaxID=280093 RepID=A0A1M5KJC7_9FLAO|nr:hypothetical protein [Flavobacterium granuli]PRZ26313.1 hypothetical protein BC624_102279 [Flavobacterium granuli]SHG52740.1 hypothetical protein SAMN05443373_102279 [Flavobacterium granuli]